jgi:hypothetical protein
MDFSSLGGAIAARYLMPSTIIEYELPKKNLTREEFEELGKIGVRSYIITFLFRFHIS